MSSKTHDTQSRCPEQMLSQVSDQQWQEMLALFPADSSQQARTHTAFLRSTGVRCPTDLLRGILAYVFCLGSFRQVGSWASSIGLCANGARSWAKRNRQEASWLLWIVQARLMPVPLCPAEEVKTPMAFTGRIHPVDTTHLHHFHWHPGDIVVAAAGSDLGSRALADRTALQAHGAIGASASLAQQRDSDSKPAHRDLELLNLVSDTRHAGENTTVDHA